MLNSLIVLGAGHMGGAIIHGMLKAPFMPPTLASATRSTSMTGLMFSRSASPVWRSAPTRSKNSPRTRKTDVVSISARAAASLRYCCAGWERATLSQRI